MKHFLKWFAGVVGVLLIGAFFFFLYFIPPFSVAPPSAFSEPELSGGPDLAKISDDTERRIAERGNYLVKSAGCVGCHVAAGASGSPNYSRYLAGGAKLTQRGNGAAYSFNLTPDVETGIGRLSKMDIVTILKKGQLPDGRILLDHVMPWTIYSHLSEEDLYAIAIYLKELEPLHGSIPTREPQALPGDPRAVESISVLDHSEH